jgi:hypothetical protein
VAWWFAYGLLLMVPWLGRYPVLLMLPNKVVVGGTGLLTTALLRLAYRHIISQGKPLPILLAAVGLGSLLGGAAWAASMAWILGGSVGDQLIDLGSIGAGVPAFAGASYHAMVLAAWSLAYVSVVTARRPGARRIGRVPSIVPAAVPPDAGAEVLVRDGRRTVRLAVREIDWIQAEGDYVRVHLTQRSLLVRETMTRLASGLTPGLVRIHRSTIVNLSRVRETVDLPNRELDVILRNGVRLRASRTYADGLRVALGSLSVSTGE